MQVKNCLLVFLATYLVFTFDSYAQRNIEIEGLINFLTLEGTETGVLMVDTSLISSQIYIPAFKKSYQNVYLGNIGTASFELFNLKGRRSYFDWGINHYKVNKFKPSTRKVYLNQKPFTSLEYLIGTKKEQLLRVVHQQHVTQNMIAGIDFLTLASNGFYRRQLSKQRSFDAFYYFNTKNEKYKLLASYTSNKNEAQENGGISDVQLFLNDTIEERNPEESDVNLLSAKSLNTDNNYFLKQEFILMNNELVDSVEQTVHKLFLRNNSNYSRNVFVFEESSIDTTFFSNIYIDSSFTYDSAFVEDLTNRIELSYEVCSDSSMNYAVGLFSDYQNIKLKQNSIDKNFIDTNFYAVGFGMNVGAFKKGRYGIKLEGSYGSIEDAKGDYRINGSSNFYVSNKFRIDLGFESYKQKPSFIKNIYYSNRFIWNEGFKDESVTNLKFVMAYNDLVSISYYNSIVDNYTYFNTMALPQQFGGTINISKVELKHHVSFKNINYKGATSYNQSSEQSVYPLPDLQLYHSIYYENKVFKVGIPIQVGFDFRYHAKYFAQGYMPATGQRHLQTEQEIGDYLFADFFLNFRINNSKIFFKIAHLNEGQGERNYFIIPNYPMAGRSFNLGVKWRFFD